MSYECFEVTIEDKVAHIQLNRPDKRNSMNPAFWRELPQIIEDIDVDTFLTSDRIALAIQHRIQIDKMMDVVMYDDDDTPVTVDLSKLNRNIKKFDHKQHIKKFKFNDVTVSTGFPTIKHDREINSDIRRLLDLENSTTGLPEEVDMVIQENTANLLLCLLNKHILEIDVNGKKISVDAGASPDMLLGAIQRLPLSLLKKVNESHDSLKSAEASIITLKHKIDNKQQDIIIDIDMGLFTGI